MGQIPENGITLVETIEDVKKIIFKKDEKLAFITQTYLWMTQKK